MRLKPSIRAGSQSPLVWAEGCGASSWGHVLHTQIAALSLPGHQACISLAGQCHSVPPLAPATKIYCFLVISALSPTSFPSYASLWIFLISSQVTMDIIYLRTPLAFLLLPLVVLGAPTDELRLTEPAPGACRRCCDPPDSSADAPPPPSSHHHLPYPMPEIRPYINITILKGECSSWPQSAKTS